MPVSLPPSINTPWKPEAIDLALRKAKGADPQLMVEYLRLVVIHLDQMYSEIASAVNRLNAEVQALKTRYDAHIAHPPPA